MAALPLLGPVGDSTCQTAGNDGGGGLCTETYKAAGCAGEPVHLERAPTLLKRQAGQSHFSVA